MIRWIERATRGRAGRTRLLNDRKRSRLTVQSLEDRTTPASPLAAPTVLDPTAAVRVDQAAYTISGTLAAPAKNGATIQVYQDSNHNGVFDPTTDALAASAVVAKKSSAFTVSVPLRQDAANQFFLVDVEARISRTRPRPR